MTRHHFIIALLISRSLVSLCRADSLDIEYRRILRAVMQDSAYTRLYYMDLKRPNLTVQTLRRPGLERTLANDTIPKSGVVREYVYRFIYLPAPFSFGELSLPLVPLLLEERLTEAERAPKGSVAPTTAVRTFFDVRDFMGMKEDPGFKKLVDELYRHHIAGKGHPLGSKISRNPYVDSTLAVEGNQGYLRHVRLSEGYVGNPHGEEPYALDATWSSLKLSLGFASQEQWLGIHSFGVEVGFGDRVLSLLSYQSPYLSWGGRMLIFFGGRGANIENNFFFDLRLLGRSPVNTGRFAERLKLSNASPLSALERNVLNVTSGAAIELRTGRPFSERLPFVTFYYSGGPKDFDQPFVKLRSHDRDIAYYSTIQWEAYLSYYWKLEREAFNTMRFDLGAGSYNIWIAELDSAGRSRSYTQLVPLTQLRPLLALAYLHDSRSARFGLNLRLFDNRLTVHPWIKVYRSDPHEVRLEFVWLTRVFGRSPQPWEVEKGSLLYVRYRYGL
ncbi:MAG: hypothetical protein C4326_12055 [Ignavibacteria bacterium]